jgi:hypothetical protein
MVNETSGGNRRAGDEITLRVHLAEYRGSVQGPDGEESGVGFKAYLDEARTVELMEDDLEPVLPGVFYTRVAGVTFHDDSLQLPQFGAGRKVEIRPEPATALDRNGLGVFGDGLRVGYLPAPIADVLAPSGTRVGHGIVLMEWSNDSSRLGIWVLGSMRVAISVASGG